MRRNGINLKVFELHIVTSSVIYGEAVPLSGLGEVLKRFERGIL